MHQTCNTLISQTVQRKKSCQLQTPRNWLWGFPLNHCKQGALPHPSISPASFSWLQSQVWQYPPDSSSWMSLKKCSTGKKWRLESGMRARAKGPCYTYSTVAYIQTDKQTYIPYQSMLPTNQIASHHSHFPKSQNPFRFVSTN